MKFKLESGKEINLPKESDVVKIQQDGKVLIQCVALKGKTDYWAYSEDSAGYKLLTKDKGMAHIVKEYNARSRTLSVNGINRPASEGAAVKRDYKEKRDSLASNKAKQAELDKDVTAYIARRASELKELADLEATMTVDKKSKEEITVVVNALAIEQAERK